MFLHDFTTMSGGFFSDTRDCVAEIAEIRGNVMQRTCGGGTFAIGSCGPTGRNLPVVSVDLGDARHFIQPPQRNSVDAKLLADF